MTEFFRHCPGCGRRFHVKLESKKLVTSHLTKIPRVTTRSTIVRGGSGRGGFIGPPPPTPITVQEGQPIIVDVEEFQYTYKCAHCGHEWTEKKFEEKREA